MSTNVHSDGTVTNRSWFRLSIFTDIASAVVLFFATLLPINSAVPEMTRTAENANRRTNGNPSEGSSRSRDGGTSLARSPGLSTASASSSSTSTPNVFVNYAWLRNNGFPDDQAVRSLLVKYATLKLTLQGRIPDELIYKIFTFTDGLVVTSVERTERQGETDNMNYRYLQIPLLNTPVFLPVSVQFTVISNDQGWTSEPGPTGQRDSFSWGEAAVTTHPSSSSSSSSVPTSSHRHHVCTNRRAERRPEQLVITKDHNDALLQEIVTSLTAARDGQQSVVLELWLRSQYPGWTNIMHEAKIQITWEMRDAILLLNSIEDFVTFK